MMNHRCYFPLRTASISFTRLRLTGISDKNRWFATSARGDNSVITLLKRLREETQVSITKAKEALQLNDNNYDKALEWLLEDAKRSGATRAENVKGRIAKEGLIGIALREGGGAIVEVLHICDLNLVQSNAFHSEKPLA